MIWFLPLFVLLCSPVRAAEPFLPVPLARAHAHNDYQHSRPLIDALQHGFCSVEADVFLVRNELLVAHNIEETRSGRTLEKLYLEPLRKRVRENGGRVFPNGPGFTLLVDFKLDEKETGKDPEKQSAQSERIYSVLKVVLKKYEGMLTRFSPDKTDSNAVTIVISGARPKTLLAEKGDRLAAMDGDLRHLDVAVSNSVVPLISDKWSRTFTWKGTGAFPQAEKEQLTKLVMTAHAQGRRIRFWGTRDVPGMWLELYNAGVDLINTDDLAGMEQFLRDQEH